MRAVRLHEYDKRPTVDEIAEPQITGPNDVVVKIGGAGLCRTDLHLVEGQWAEKTGTPLPFTLGHENAGWVHEVGSAVEHLSPGDTVILHPQATCGLCRACRAGDDMHCGNSFFPGLNTDGGMADYLRTGVRAVVKIDPKLQPADVAMLRRAGSYFVIGYGGAINVPTIDIISTEINFVGNLVGTFNDLDELMTLAAQGQVKLHTQTYPLDAVNDAMDDLDAGRLRGRGILVP